MEGEGSSSTVVSEHRDTRRGSRSPHVEPLVIEDMEDRNEEEEEDDDSDSTIADSASHMAAEDAPHDPSRGWSPRPRLSSPGVREDKGHHARERGRKSAGHPARVEGRRTTYKAAAEEEVRGRRETYHGVGESKGHGPTAGRGADSADRRRATYGGSPRRPTILGRVPTPTLSETSSADQFRIRHHLDRTTPSVNGILIPVTEDHAPFPTISPKFRRDMLSTAPIYPAPSCDRILEQLVEEEARERASSVPVDPSVPRPVRASISPYHQNCTPRNSDAGGRGERAGSHIRVLDFDGNSNEQEQQRLGASSSCQTCGEGHRKNSFHPSADVAVVPEAGNRRERGPGNRREEHDRRRKTVTRLDSDITNSTSGDNHRWKGRRSDRIKMAASDSSSTNAASSDTIEECRRRSTSKTKSPMRPSSVRHSVPSSIGAHHAHVQGKKKVWENRGKLKSKALDKEKAWNASYYSKPLPQFGGGGCDGKVKGRSSSAATVTTQKGRADPPQQQQRAAPREDSAPLRNRFACPAHAGPPPPAAAAVDVDQLSLSSMSISNCSVASELLEKAKKRRDHFWSSQHPHE